MLFSVKTDELSKALALLLPVCPTRTFNPVLRNVLITADNDELVMCATDMDVEMSLHIPATVEVGGTVTVPAGLLLKAVKQIRQSEICVECEEASPGGVLTLKPIGGHRKIKFATINPASFPRLPREKSVNGVELNTVEFQKCLLKTFHATCNDESKPELCGVALIPEEGNTVIAATDGKRLALCNYADVLVSETIIIPSKVVNILKHNVGNYGAAQFFATRDRLQIVVNGFELIGRLIDGSYPNVNRVIPKNIFDTLSLNCVEAVNAIGFASIVNNNHNNYFVIDMVIEDKKIKFKSLSADVGEAEVVLEQSYDFTDEYFWHFNPFYLADAITSAGSDSVEFKIVGSHSPVCICSDNYTSVVMPMRV